jgi:beta-phosphoglucomutase family hydrolase
LRLPGFVQACLFDMDGVLTDTAGVHARAWKETFDGFLRARALRENLPYVPFDAVHDYDEYVDGKERLEGVRSFLAARDLELPEGTPGDPASAETIGGLGNRKNELLLARIESRRVEVFEGSVEFVRAVKGAGLRRAVVSASANCREVLEAAGIAGLFEVRVDGIVAEHEHLRSKPEPDMYLRAAHSLAVPPARAAVFEDALAGVSAGRAGGFGYIVGVDRVGQAEGLRARGANLVVADLAELLE